MRALAPPPFARRNIMTVAAQSPPIVSDSYRSVFADILSQAVSGELIGMQNYAAMVELYDDVEEQIEAVEHANNECGHAMAFRQAARDLGVEVIENPRAPYWRRIREAFLGQVRKGDRIACLLIQEIMLEAFAVSMYHAVAEAAVGDLGRVFDAIGSEEEGHLEHAIRELQEARHADPDGFEDKAHQLHNEVMTVLAEMVGAHDAAGPCELCHGSCVKDSLHHVGLSTSVLRGKALAFYLQALDRIGVRGDRSLEWVANLPT
jgi:fatty aldehyde decarbonylase